MATNEAANATIKLGRVDHINHGSAISSSAWWVDVQSCSQRGTGNGYERRSPWPPSPLEIAAPIIWSVVNFRVAVLAFINPRINVVR